MRTIAITKGYAVTGKTSLGVHNENNSHNKGICCYRQDLAGGPQ